MPGYVIHLAVGQVYMQKTKINHKDEFIKGIMAPDMLGDKSKSHYGPDSSSPNLNRYIKLNNKLDDFKEGYFLHLLTDYLFYNDFLEKWAFEIYSDYNKINAAIVERYKIKIPDEIKSVVKYEEGNPCLLDLDSVLEFIEYVANINVRCIFNENTDFTRLRRGVLKMEEIIIASGNKGKIAEVQEILKDYKIVSIEDKGINIDVEEDKETFEENAIKKAETISKLADGNKCIADDSGIEIEYLDGFPGVFTKRWNEGTDRDRNLAIIQKLKGVPKEKRKVKFVTAIAIADKDGTFCEIGTIDGFIAENVRGSNGFGFDEIFELRNGKTLAELSNEEKNEISARKIALSKIQKRLSQKDK